MTRKLTSSDVELALSGYFHARKNFIIPNVRWGWRGLRYEIDLMIVTPAMCAYEVEIKISAGDLRRDAKKCKWNYCQSQHYFRKSYFAMPVDMLKYLDLVPAHCGVLLVGWSDKRHWYEVDEARKPTTDALAKPVTATEYADLGRLCMLRMWDLKTTLKQNQWRNEAQPETAEVI